jgi:hypothetical protein
VRIEVEREGVEGGVEGVVVGVDGVAALVELAEGWRVADCVAVWEVESGAWRVVDARRLFVLTLLEGVGGGRRTGLL